MSVLSSSTPETYCGMIKETPKIFLNILKAFNKDEEDLEATKLLCILSERATGCLEAFTNKERTQVTRGKSR